MSSVEYRSHEGMPTDDVIAELVAVSQAVFGPGMDAAEFKRGLQGKEHIYTLLAHLDGQVVGYKLGYMQRSYYFESWRGGVVESARRRGIATELQRRQHVWCKEQGFRILTTTTDGNNAPMLILNLQHGYAVVGSFLDRGKHLKVILQKRIDGEG